jgi:hypothetical protein
MIDDCLQNKQSCIILTELPEHNKDQDIYKTNNHLSSLLPEHKNDHDRSSVKMTDDCSFCRCRGLSCVQRVLLR